MSATIAISKRAIQETDGVVVLPVAAYRRLLESSVPTYYLTGNDAEKLDELVEEGLRDYKEGRTIEASSIGEALKMYGRGRKAHRARSVL